MLDSWARSKVNPRVIYVTNTVHEVTIREVPAPSQPPTVIHPLFEHMPTFPAAHNYLVYTNGIMTVIPNGGAR